ncbi:MAG: heme exporter protein CcmD [Anaerolineae bacterium]|nr:heme exporter protein CcmD [Anaerolineae bacterium]
MDYVIIAYGLIALVLIGYTIHLHWRIKKIERERTLLEQRD